MAAPQNAPLTPFFTLDSGMQVVVTAIDATTGLVVAGVKVSNVSIDVDNKNVMASLIDNTPEPLLVPLTS